MKANYASTWTGRPSESQRMFLQAACLPAEAAAKAWRQWRAQVDLESADPASARLLPWIYLRREELSVEPGDLERLQGCYRFAWLRNQVILNRCTEVLRALREAGVETMLLKGIPLLQDAYGDEGGRYMEDFDVMVREEHAGRASEILVAAGWAPLVPAKVSDEGRKLRHSHPFYDADGNQCDLHWQLFPRPFEPVSEEALWRTRRPLTSWSWMKSMLQRSLGRVEAGRGTRSIAGSFLRCLRRKEICSSR